MSEVRTNVNVNLDCEVLGTISAVCSQESSTAAVQPYFI